MRRFKIVWKDHRYGESEVSAKNKEEAMVKALNDEDEDFEELDACMDWFIFDVIDITNFQ